MTRANVRWATASASSASAAECWRPRKLSAASSSACTPSETRLTPASRKRGELLRLDRGGIGLERDLERALGPARGPQARAPLDHRGDGLGRHQRRRAAAEEDAGEPASRELAGACFPARASSAARQRGCSIASRDMAVEVAIGAFRPAERPVDIETERSRPRSSPAAGSRRAGQLAEGSRAMADGVLASGSISPKVCVMAVGHEDRVVAEAVCAARRPHQGPVDLAFDGLDMAVGPGERQRADETCAAVVRLPTLPSRRPAPWRRAKSALRARPARRIDAGRAVQRRDREPGIVGERRQPGRSAAARALSSALATKLVPVSSGSGRPSAPADTTSSPNGASSAAISRTLPGLWLATTSRPPSRMRAIGPSAVRTYRCRAPRAAAPSSSPTPLRASASSASNCAWLERGALRRCPGPRRCRRRRSARNWRRPAAVAVLGIVEVEHRGAVEDAAGDRRDLVGERHRLERARRHQLRRRRGSSAT